MNNQQYPYLSVDEGSKHYKGKKSMRTPIKPNQSHTTGSKSSTVNYDIPCKDLDFTSVTHQTYWLPTENEYLVNLDGPNVYHKVRYKSLRNSTEVAERGKSGNYTSKLYVLAWLVNAIIGFIPRPPKASYLRNTTEVAARGKLGKCTSTLDVLAWLMDKVNDNNGNLMIAYGELIHIHREKDFVNKTTGKYIDDDIDTWASLETVVFIAQLEEELFSLFGWSMRVFINADKYTVFLQIMATCGHIPSARASKVSSSQPAIELYPISIVQINGDRIVKDLWQGSKIPESMVYPVQRIDVISAGTSYPLHLQLPHKSLSILDCLYGNWMIPSGKHAGSIDCQHYKDLI